jgi:hypothetical protein
LWFTQQDDIAIITSKLGRQPADHGNTLASATQLIPTPAPATASSTTSTATASAQGLVEAPGTWDYFRFSSGAAGAAMVAAQVMDPFGSLNRANVDLYLTLMDRSGRQLAAANPANALGASVSFELPGAGTYYIGVTGTGSGSASNGKQAHTHKASLELVHFEQTFSSSE